MFDYARYGGRDRCGGELRASRLGDRANHQRCILFQRCVAFRWRARFLGGGFVDEDAAAEPPFEGPAERALTDVAPPPPPGSCCCSDERLPSSSVTSRRKMRHDLMTVRPCLHPRVSVRAFFFFNRGGGRGGKQPPLLTFVRDMDGSLRRKDGQVKVWIFAQAVLRKRQKDQEAVSVALMREKVWSAAHSPR